MRVKFQFTVDVQEESDISLLSEEIDEILGKRNCGILSFSHDVVSEDEKKVYDFMNALVTGLLKNEQYAQEIQEQCETNPQHALEREEICLFLREDHKRMIVSSGDWARIGEEAYWEILSNLIEQNAHLLGEDVKQKLVQIDSEAEFSPPLTDDEEHEIDQDDLKEYGGLFESLGMLSDSWLQP